MSEEKMNEQMEPQNVEPFGDEQFVDDFSQEGFVDLDGYEYVDLEASEYVPVGANDYEFVGATDAIDDADPLDPEEEAEAELQSEAESNASASQPKRAKHARVAAPATAAPVAAASTTAVTTSAAAKPAGAARGKHAKPDPVISESVKKSRKTRKILIGVLVVLVLALAGVGGGMAFMLKQSPAPNSDDAVQQQTTEQDALKNAETSDASTGVEKRTSVPNVMNLLGKTEQQILKELQHGATVKASLDVNDPTQPYAKSVTIELADEYADARTGLPKVYVGLNKKGHAVQIGYSVGTALLGYSSMDIKEAMTKDHIVEQVTNTAGISVKEGSLKLPKKVSDYTTYGTDGKTVVKERAAFDGITKKAGTRYMWESVLLFDYTTSSVTGNINDTAHQVYIYVTDEKAQKAADKAAKKKAKEDAKKKAKEEAKKKAAAKKAAEKAAKKS